MSFETLIPVLDPRNEQQLSDQAIAIVSNRSGGLLNDFSDHSPIAALMQGFAFSAAELLYYTNQLPYALVLKFLQTSTGIVQSLGQKATVSLTFTLSAPLSNSFQIPANFQILGSDNLSYFTDSILTIPPGSSFGIVSATAENIGSIYNKPAYTINRITQPIAFLASVLNVEDSQGGLEAESDDSLINRALLSIRTRNLVSEFDFNNATESILGLGSKAKTIGLLGADKITKQNGVVHVFALDVNGSPVNSSQIAQISQALIPRLMLGTQLLIDPMGVLSADGLAIVHLEDRVDVTTVSRDLWSAFKEYFNPNALIPGATVLISEITFALRTVSGIKYIEELTINNIFDRVPMNNAYTIPKANSLNITLVDSNGNPFNIAFGILD